MRKKQPTSGIGGRYENNIKISQRRGTDNLQRLLREEQTPPRNTEERRLEALGLYDVRRIYKRRTIRNTLRRLFGKPYKEENGNGGD